MNRIRHGVVLAALLWAAPAGAAPIFSLIPADGSVVADPGQTVGWGYEIVNDDPTQWLVVSSLSAAPFEFGVGSDLIFDFPILAPGTSLVRPYVAGLQGLYEFTWDATAPAGFTNSGTFTIGAELWDGDPFVDGGFVSTVPDFTAAYSVSTFDAAPVPTPEPASLILVGCGIALFGARRKGLRENLEVKSPEDR
jgi:hypothetical protein